MSQYNEGVIMPINIDQQRTTVGLFYGNVYAVIPNNKNFMTVI